VVFVATAFISCSKSADQLAGLQAPGDGNARMGKSREAANASDTWTKVYPEINQPRATVLGNFDSYLFDGDQAVFYVVINGRDDLPQLLSGTLTLVDEATGDEIQTIDMIPYYDPAASNLYMPPGDVMLSPYMLAVVNINSQYVGKTVTLQSSIQLPDGEISTTSLQAAFIVQ